MRLEQAVAELIRRNPKAAHVEARISAGNPAPEHRCMVAAWDTGATIGYFGHGYTFDAALADADKRAGRAS